MLLSAKTIDIALSLCYNEFNDGGCVNESKTNITKKRYLS